MPDLDRVIQTKWGEMSLGMVILARLQGVPVEDLRPDTDASPATPETTED